MKSRDKKILAALLVVALVLCALLWPARTDGPADREMTWNEPVVEAGAFDLPIHRAEPRPTAPEPGGERNTPKTAPASAPVIETEPADLPPSTRPLVEQRGDLEILIEVEGRFTSEFTVFAEPITGIDAALHRRRTELRTTWRNRSDGPRKWTLRGLTAVTWLVYIPGMEPRTVEIRPDETTTCRLAPEELRKVLVPDRWRAGTILGLHHRGVSLEGIRVLGGGNGAFEVRGKSREAFQVSGKLDDVGSSWLRRESRPGGGIVGTVRDATGKAVAGAVVAVYPGSKHDDGRPATHPFEVVADADGRFTAHGLARGRVDVHARHIGFAMNRSLSVQVFEGDVTEANLTLTPSSSVTGMAWKKVGDDTRPCSLAYVAHRNEARRVIRVARDGSWRLDGLVGAVKLIAAPASWLPAERRRLSRLMNVSPGVVERWDFVLEETE